MKKEINTCKTDKSRQIQAKRDNNIQKLATTENKIDKKRQQTIQIKTDNTDKKTNNKE